MALSKDFILAEIERLARENGGTPLGRDRFARETGIREKDWAGRFWVRWSDAVQEAGFRPNELQESYASDALLKDLAELCRELQRFPVRNEMRLKRRSDPAFPNDKVFDRFGSKNELIARVATFCRSNADYADVLPLCVLPDTPALDQESSGSDESFGWVCLLKSGRHYKIGKSNAVGRRERELAIQLPEKAVVAHAIRTDDPAGIEAYWHQRFAHKRMNGEWFALDAQDVGAFRRRKFM